jgi:glycosyltransferase involved in cell wall biosynthesis
MNTQVSIIIPNLNSPVIPRVLEAVRKQTAGLRRTEVLVVGRDDPGLVEEDRLVRFVESERPMPPAQARNRGLASSRGKIVVFLDADCVPDTDWLARLLDPYSDASVHVVGGSMALAAADSWTLADNIATFHEYLNTRPAGLRDLLPSFSLSCRRSALETVGGFDEAYPYPAGEDADLTLRLRLAGYPLHFEPRAVVRHYPSRTRLSSLLRHAYRFGQYSVKVDPRYADLLQVPWVLQRAWRVFLAAPFMAGAVTWRAFRHDRQLWRLWPLAAIMYLAKLAWCAGAICTLRRGADSLAPWGTVYRLPRQEAST